MMAVAFDVVSGVNTNANTPPLAVAVASAPSQTLPPMAVAFDVAWRQNTKPNMSHMAV